MIFFNYYRAVFCLLLIFSLVGCQEEEVTPVKVIEQGSELIIPQAYMGEYRYVHHGEVFNEGDWMAKWGSQDDFGMISLGDLVYVFDTQDEAMLFEQGDFQKILAEYTVQEGQKYTNSSNARVVGSIVWGTATYRLSLYEHKDYGGNTLVRYRNHRMGRKKTSIGYEWVDNEYRERLPSYFRKTASSYKMEYLNTPVRIDGYYMVLDMRLYTGADFNGPTWKKKLYHDPQAGTMNTLEQDNNLHNNRIWGAFGIGNWGDNIQSVEVKFNSY